MVLRDFVGVVGVGVVCGMVYDGLNDFGGQWLIGLYGYFILSIDYCVYVLDCFNYGLVVFRNLWFFGMSVCIKFYVYVVCF